MDKYIKLEDAIYGDCILMDKIKCEDCPFYDEEHFSCKMVEWLENLPTIEVSEDAISREWAINKQKELIELYTPHKTVEGRGQVCWQIEERELVAKELEQAPSVVPKAKEGE